MTTVIGRFEHIGLGFLLYYATQTERFARKLCNFIIRNYIQTFLEIGTNSFASAHLKNPDIFTPILTWEIGSENIDFFRCTET